MQEVLKIKGMSCGHCVNAVAKALSEVEGVSDVKVSIEKGEASFSRTDAADMSQIKKRIERAGYEVG
jgi:copper chaperone